MSSSSEDSDVEVPPKRRKRVAGKENHTPSPESEQLTKKRPSGKPAAVASKKIKIQNSMDVSPTQGFGSQGCGMRQGKIIEVRLVNFMCHSNLKFTFGDKVNFISGKNGSGKSAILTALVLGLGGKTSDTNRGTSLARLIKSGEPRGSIEITISNKGDLGYDTVKYGDTITVVRNINEKISSYKLLSSTGKVVSTKKSELQLITMAFNIQVNNPVSILNQDTARSFLKTATPKELYSLFRKGTLIEEIESNLEELKVRKLPLIRSLLKRKEKALKESVKEIVEYSEKIRKYSELVKLQENMSSLQNTLYWVYVSELEEKLERTKVEKLELEQAIVELRQKFESRESVEENLKMKLEELRIKVQSASDDCEVAERSGTELEQKVAYHKGIVNRKVSEMKKLQKKIETEESRCQEIQAGIDNTQRNTQEVEEKRNQMMQNRSDLKKRCEELKAVISTTETHKQQISDTVDEIERKVTQNMRYTENLARNISEKEKYIRGLKSTKNELRVFSEWMPQLVAEIDRMAQRGLFKEKPRGPCGQYIKLKDDEWGPVVEHVLSNCLMSFLVSNSGDLAMMKKLMDKLNIPKDKRPNITITKFQNQVYDCSSTEVTHPRYKNLFRSIEITDPVVANTILDLVQPDTILLVPTTSESYSLVENERNVPPNLKRLMNTDGSLFYPAPDYRCYSGNLPSRIRFLQVSPAQAIKIAEDEMRAMREDLGSRTQDLDGGKSKHAKEKLKLNSVLRELDTLRRQLASCETKLYQAEQEELPESFSVNILTEDLEYRRGQMEAIVNQLKVLGKEKDEVYELCKSLKGSFLEMEKQKEELITKKTELKKELSQTENELKKYLMNHNHFKDTLKTEMVKKDRFGEKLAVLERDLKNAVKAATEMCPERVRDERPKHELEKKLQEVTASVKSMEKIVGKRPTEPLRFEERMAKFSENHESLRRVSSALEGLFETYSAMEKKNQEVLALVCSNCCYEFRQILAKRNFLGDMKIDHNIKTLVLNVKPDPRAENNSAITTLSGGERSYSMVAFIMALWKNMSAPFYFLDEFDVFMDEVNRKLIMELLMEHARSNPKKQFVFLTPHATSDESTQDVHFFRMEDPRG